MNAIKIIQKEVLQKDILSKTLYHTARYTLIILKLNAVEEVDMQIPLGMVLLAG
jgi:hypothetical protein